MKYSPPTVVLFIWMSSQNQPNSGERISQSVMIICLRYKSNKKNNNKTVREIVTILAWLNELSKKNNINSSNTLHKLLINILDVD